MDTYDPWNTERKNNFLHVTVMISDVMNVVMH
jgi:hypothetical protein